MVTHFLLEELYKVLEVSERAHARLPHPRASQACAREEYVIAEGTFRGKGDIALEGSDKMLWDTSFVERAALEGGRSTRYLGNRGRR